MAVPHYTYLKMKLPGPRGVITVPGCFKKSMECARASSQLAEALVITEEKRQLLHRVALTQQDVPVHQSLVVTSQVFKYKNSSCIHGILHTSDSYKVLNHISSNTTVSFPLLHQV
jgi:hypothetical protein